MERNRKRFLSLCQRAGIEPPSEILPAIYLLSNIEELEIEKYVSSGRVDFKTLELISHTWKPAERALFKLAGELCGENERSADLEELFSNLDWESRNIAITVLDLYALIVS